MSSNLNFDSTKRFRDFMISRTLQSPNGPQTFDSNNYIVKNLNSYSNQELGDVETNRNEDLKQSQVSNIYKPEDYYIVENLDVLSRRANLNLYPYFSSTENHNLISILAGNNYDNESELMKFAADYIKDDKDGPINARITQNLYSATIGRLRIIDALENPTTATNIITGRESLVELNNKITVAKTLPGKAIDFMQTVAGVEFPWNEIPGDYLSDPRNPINNRNESQTEAGKTYQDVTGVLGSLIGIKRRPKFERKPSDLMIEYLGQGSKQRLFDNLSYSKYAPDYTTTARSQNSSKIFNFIDKTSEGIKDLLNLEAPRGIAYIGDDRGSNVNFAMNDFNDRPVRSPYYLSLFFDEEQAKLFQKNFNITEGGSVSGNLTWISSKSKNETSNDTEEFNSTLSTKFTFRDDSILGKTQEILETLPTNGGEARSHVANVIDQTSKIFKNGNLMLSKGSAVKYVDKYSGVESGAEFCRVWTKDNPYMNNGVLMKNGTNIRKFTTSNLTSPYNINIYPNSNGDRSFDNSSNIVKGGDGFYAKKYMFSIENLAWKTSNVPGFTYNDLPYCERGNNGGRVMWFPPYNIDVAEQNSAEWSENVFLGRPEPIYTYTKTNRNATISFKVIVDHPSILNLLVKKHFANMSDEEADNYINSFFAGCEDVDFYDLIRTYPTLQQTDIEKIIAYLENGKDPETIKKYNTIFEDVEDDNTPETKNTKNDKNNNDFESLNYAFLFDNDKPRPSGDKTLLYSNEDFDNLSKNYIGSNEKIKEDFNSGIDELITILTTRGDINIVKNDSKNIFGKEILDPSVLENGKIEKGKVIDSFFSIFDHSKNQANADLTFLKEKIEQKEIDKIKIKISSTTSEVADSPYNLKLSFRRSYVIINYILDKLKKTDKPPIKWSNTNISDDDTEIKETSIPLIKFSELGYEDVNGEIEFVSIYNYGENTFPLSDDINCSCGEKSFYIDKFKTVAPVSIGCRLSTVSIKYRTTNINDDINEEVEAPKTKIVPENIPVTTKPPLDEVKRIVMKTLSECYYFKQMEEDTPTVFNSLKEKFKYFHPSFHSSTPEALNSRLTFLQQCIRPGDTLPIKGVSEENDLNARNTTFGPPPVCILRVGDFFHSKVIIRDINITYEDNLWDLNPEGIGIQPMIAKVDLTLTLIGGHGLEKPVERLQNALSFNFYGNTEMYDHRSTATENRKDFNKSFLEELMESNTEEIIPKTNTNSSNKTKEGDFIGTIIDSGLTYNNLIRNVFTLNKEYFNNYINGFYVTSGLYGTKLATLFFSPTYRTVHQYDVKTNTGTKTLSLLGEFPKIKHLGYYLDHFKYLMLSKLNDDSTNVSLLMGFNKIFNTTLLTKSEIIIKRFLNEFLNDYIDDIYSNPSVNKVVESRNNLISTLDRLNFITNTNYDGKIIDGEAVAANLIGFSSFYNKYKTAIDYISNSYSDLIEYFDGSYDFTKSKQLITDDEFKEFLGIFLRDEKNTILDLYSDYDDILFNSSKINKISRKLDDFLIIADPKTITVDKFPELNDTKDISFNYSEESGIFTEEEENNLNKIHSSKVELGTKLNFYKP